MHLLQTGGSVRIPTRDELLHANNPHDFVPNSYGMEHVCALAFCHRYKDEAIHQVVPPQQTTPESKNAHTLKSFTDYCVANPEMRFWQALRNWSGYHFLFVSDSHGIPAQPLHDTFNFAGRRHDDQ